MLNDLFSASRMKQFVMFWIVFDPGPLGRLCEVAHTVKIFVLQHLFGRRTDLWIELEDFVEQIFELGRVQFERRTDKARRPRPLAPTADAAIVPIAVNCNFVFADIASC